MLSIAFRLKACTAITHIVAIISGIPYGNAVSIVPFRQYTTSIPIIADGSTLPRYEMYFGTFFLKVIKDFLYF